MVAPADKQPRLDALDAAPGATAPAHALAGAAASRVMGDNPEGPAVTQIERNAHRLCTRRKSVENGAVARTADDTAGAVPVENVSMLGVNFRSPIPFQPESIHHIRAGIGQKVLSFPIRIVSCRPRSDGKFDIGAEFF
ncbi:MAG: hypothetical protein ACREIT_03470 [Tepidisphaeraceae bacterium]